MTDELAAVATSNPKHAERAESGFHAAA